MKVTQRQSVHEYPHFAEIRYFRFGERSSLAAVLFGLFEQLRLPDFQSLRENLSREVEENTAIRNKRILSFLLEPRIRTECMFAAWNYDELVLDAVVEAVGQLGGRGDVVATLREKVGFQVLTKEAELVTSPMQTPTIYMETAEQSAILLYPGRTVESYIVTRCRHLYIKSDILAWVKSLMNRRSSLSEIENISYPCEVSKCQKPIGVDLFESANKPQIQPSTLYFDLILSQEGTLQKYFRETSSESLKCQHCGVRNAPCECSARCRICIECALVAYCSQGYACRCPVCGERLSKELCLLLGEELPRRVRWTQLPHSYTSCDYCRQAVTIGEVREIIQGERLKFACPNCSIDQKSTSLAAIPGKASLEDSMNSRFSVDPNSPTRSLRFLPFPRGYTGYINPSLGDFLEKCLLCGRQSSCYEVINSLKHPCWVCDDCVFSLFDSKRIPTCPICESIFGKSGLKVIKEWREVASSHPDMNSPVSCSLCLLEKPRKEAAKGERLDHNCSICNACLLAFQSPTSCPMCLQTYSQQDQAFLALFLSSIPSQTVSPTSSQFGSMRMCLECKESVGKSQPKCPKACLCSLCLLRNYVFTSRSRCPKCSSGLTGRLPETVYCSNCCRQLVVQSQSVDAVSAVCDTACVLCCFCVQVSSTGLLCCKVCRAEVESIETEHITRWQRGFSLGCYCGKEQGTKVRMPCGCKAHSECFPKLRECRTCGYAYKKKSQPRKLTSYFT